MTPTGLQTEHPVLARIQSEFTEMPGLCPTVRQAARLWNLDAQTLQMALDALVDAGVLACTNDGRLVTAERLQRGGASPTPVTD